ncbi:MULTISPECIES: hypothetical protein [Yersinia]|uniref:Uncharacterized protein n=3 Tax=Yersinia bercovieri TaxID=634 RepID=A0A2G4U313_YERBE|nr:MULTISPECIES: hypothetical protein [Yersinia]MCB5300719.1 hypothetical protein [Yersinia bercovieri]MDN0103625.1 hypothetical protein [Yersinia bercovieri]PHZ27166.1 hypothetical protein CS533_12150 [Yersinia bercovieri]QDW33557.1 hypothetical protein FFE93_011120 [Yersinia sp. KBS0713]QKJ08094.1 hypothetical protein HRK25_15105 [Yersinia bercovieri ATCC 43970]
MNVNEEKLLKSGFTNAELQKIKNNVESYGGTLGEAIQDLANKFRVVLWITSACLMVFIFLVLFSSKQTVVGGGLSLLIAVVIVTFIQPPVLSYKSWRYWRGNIN